MKWSSHVRLHTLTSLVCCAMRCVEVGNLYDIFVTQRRSLSGWKKQQRNFLSFIAHILSSSSSHDKVIITWRKNSKVHHISKMNQTDTNQFNTALYRRSTNDITVNWNETFDWSLWMFHIDISTLDGARHPRQLCHRSHRHYEDCLQIKTAIDMKAFLSKMKKDRRLSAFNEQ